MIIAYNYHSYYHSYYHSSYHFYYHFYYHLYFLYHHSSSYYCRIPNYR